MEATFTAFVSGSRCLLPCPRVCIHPQCFAIASLSAPSTQRVPKQLWTDNDEGELIQVRSCNDERDEAAQVVGTIRAWEDEGISRKQMAVLYRTHAQSRVLEEALRSARIGYRIVGGLRFFDRAEIKDLLALIVYKF